MGTVYLASDTLLARQVALKVLDARGDSEDQAHRVRLLREARLAAGVEHERIARVYDVGEHDGSTFVAMEYVRGITLRAWMREPHEPAEVLEVMRQIAEGLSVLHENGVVHRDLKPENVMFQSSGGVKLLDFGLAGHVDSPGEINASGRAPFRGMARSSSAFVGTPGYMSPEQYLGQRAGVRADVFALGVIVSELVTGERPFKGATMAALLQAVQEQPRELAGPAWGRFPPRLTDVVARMLQADMEARYRSGTESLTALRDLDGPDTHATWMGHRGRWVGALALLLVSVSVAVAAPRLTRYLSARRPMKGPAPPGMVLVDEGTLTVGQSVEAVARQCNDMGPRCDRKLLGYQVPAGRVTVPSFYMDVHEVTNHEMVHLLNMMTSSIFVARDEDDQSLRYVRFNSGVGSVDGYLLDLDPLLGGIEYTSERTFRARAGRENWPVNQVTWFAANLYCSTIGKRLPTEDEWEAAARGNADRTFPWGNEAPLCGQVVIPADGLLPGAPDCPPTASPADVGSAAQDVTPKGVHDLAGNVAEWVDTVYAEGARINNGTNPSDVQRPRVLRGGAFYRSLLARTSMRNMRPPSYVGYDLGFRCAVDVGSSRDPKTIRRSDSQP